MTGCDGHFSIRWKPFQYCTRLLSLATLAISKFLNKFINSKVKRCHILIPRLDLGGVEWGQENLKRSFSSINCDWQSRQSPWSCSLVINIVVTIIIIISSTNRLFYDLSQSNNSKYQIDEAFPCE